MSSGVLLRHRRRKRCLEERNPLESVSLKLQEPGGSWQEAGGIHCRSDCFIWDLQTLLRHQPWLSTVHHTSLTHIFTALQLPCLHIHLCLWSDHWILRQTVNCLFRMSVEMLSESLILFSHWKLPTGKVHKEKTGARGIFVTLPLLSYPGSWEMGFFFLFSNQGWWWNITVFLLMGVTEKHISFPATGLKARVTEGQPHDPSGSYCRNTECLVFFSVNPWCVFLWQYVKAEEEI